MLSPELAANAADSLACEATERREEASLSDAAASEPIISLALDTIGMTGIIVGGLVLAELD